MSLERKPRITLFHCLNSFSESPGLFDGCDASIVRMACSSMTRDIFLLKAFESGADAVIVLVCPDRACRHIQGSIRARKRVDYVKGILDEIGMDSRRLAIFNTRAGDADAVKNIVREVLTELKELGPNRVAAA